MAVSEPAGLPPWQAAQQSQPEALYSEVPRSIGEPRRRRVFTAAPRRLVVTRLLSAAQALALRDWFEADLQAGALSCSTTVAAQAGGSETVEAYFLPDSPPQFEAQDHGHQWQVRAELITV